MNTIYRYRTMSNLRNYYQNRPRDFVQNRPRLRRKPPSNPKGGFERFLVVQNRLPNIKYRFLRKLIAQMITLFSKMIKELQNEFLRPKTNLHIIHISSLHGCISKKKIIGLILYLHMYKYKI